MNNAEKLDSIIRYYYVMQKNPKGPRPTGFQWEANQKIPRISPALGDLLESKTTMKKLPQTEEIFKRFEIGLYEAALKSNPNNVEALRSLGYIYSSEGLHDKAVEIDQRLVRLLPDESIVHYNLACSYSQLNNLDGALSELEMSVLLGYNDWKHMDGDKDLDNLRKDPRYQQVMSALKKKYIV